MVFPVSEDLTLTLNSLPNFFVNNLKHIKVVPQGLNWIAFIGDLKVRTACIFTPKVAFEASILWTVRSLIARQMIYWSSSS